jgi:hypothetical protein
MGKKPLEKPIEIEKVNKEKSIVNLKVKEDGTKAYKVKLHDGDLSLKRDKKYDTGDVRKEKGHGGKHKK